MDDFAWLDLYADDPAATLPPGASIMEKMAGKLAGERQRIIEKMSPTLLPLGAWAYLARKGQMPPPGDDWKTWLIMAGRGFGKTRAGAEWVRARAEVDGRARIALVAASMHEARAVMVEGESGLLAICPAHNRPIYESSNRKLTWTNGAQAFLFSAGEPESLRGAQHHFAWCDEIGKWSRGQAAWDNLEFGLRLGTHPRIVATTTPRPIALVKRVRFANSTVTTTGRTADNAAHLAPSFIASLTERHAGTLTGRQELDGELIEDVEGALWSRTLIEQARVAAAPALVRVVIGVDPPAGASERSDACGIVVTGQSEDGHGYVLADASVRGLSPEGWARAVSAAAAAWGADRIVVEGNNGGAMVESVLRAIDAVLPITIVHARQGKVARAEPVQALYASGRVFHVGAFQDLEDEMCGLMLGGAYEGPGRSPDRADALVWALHALLLRARRAGPAIRVM